MFLSRTEPWRGTLGTALRILPARALPARKFGLLGLSDVTPRALGLDFASLKAGATVAKEPPPRRTVGVETCRCEPWVGPCGRSSVGSVGPGPGKGRLGLGFMIAVSESVLRGTSVPPGGRSWF